MIHLPQPCSAGEYEGRPRSFSSKMGVTLSTRLLVCLWTFLCITVVSLWIKSYWPPSFVLQHRGSGYFAGMDLVPGGLDFILLTDEESIRRLETSAFLEQDAQWFELRHHEPQERQASRTIGSLFWAPEERHSPGLIRVVVPFWMLAGALVIPPGYLVCSRMRRSRRLRFRIEHGLCLRCDYDLTGNVSGVCPECGAEVKQP